MHRSSKRQTLISIFVLLIAGGWAAGPSRGDVRINESNVTAANPSLAHGPNGVLYAAVEDATLQWLYVYRSTDHGSTWSYMTGITGGPSGFDASYPSIACGQDGSGMTWVFVAYEDRDPSGTRGVDILRFDGNNPSNADIFYVVGGIQMDDSIHPALCTDWPTYTNFSVYLAYNRRGGIDPAMEVVFARSDDLCQSWRANQVLASSPLSTNQRPAIAFGGPIGFPGDSYRVFVTYENAVPAGSGWTNDVFIRASRDFGNSWDPPAQLTTSADDDYDARVAAPVNDPAVVVVYTSNWLNSGDLDIRYAYSVDAGVNWTTAQLLAGSGLVEMAPDITVLYNHRFHCAYWTGFNIIYRWADPTSPTQWSDPGIVNDTQTADPTHPRPAVCAMVGMPESSEGSLAWTDLRNSRFDTYFDLAPAGSSAVALGDVKLPGGTVIELSSPYPNPGRGGETTHFPLRLSRAAAVRLDLYDAGGRKIATSPVFDLGPGPQIVDWRIGKVASGAYSVRVMTGSGPTATARWIAMR